MKVSRCTLEERNGTRRKAEDKYEAEASYSGLKQESRMVLILLTIIVFMKLEAQDGSIDRGH